MTEENRRFYEAQLRAEVVVLTEMLRIMSEKIAELEKEKTLEALRDENERLALYEKQE
jgi:hypothetical protein